jgi:predicted ester cyclase
MSEANKQLAKRWFEEVWNKGRREAIGEILAPDAEIRESGEIVKGPDGFYPFFDRMQAAFSEIHVTFQDAIAEADMVCLRWSCSMKHTGGGLGIPPTQRTLTTTGITIVRVANARFVAGWQNWDMLGLMQQIKQEPMAPTYIAAKVGRAV